MGYGTQLVSKAEELAREAGCISANTSSHSFQAPEFYQKIGYMIVGTLEGCPEGIKKLYFEKMLKK